MKKALFAAALLFASALYAGPVYSISIDTSSLSGSGSFYWAFDSLVGADPGTVTISSFTGDLGSFIESSPGTGELPGDVVLANDGSYYVHGVGFGGMFSFLVNFNIAVSGTATAGSSFGISVYDGDDQPQLSTDLDGVLFRAEVEPATGAVTPIVYPMNNDGEYAISYAEVPEPSAAGLVLAGLAAGLLAWRRRSR